MSAPLRVAGFGGGVVLEGSPDVRKVGELSGADGYDLGSRGNLTAASGPTGYVTLNDDGNTPAPLARVFGLVPTLRDGTGLVVAMGRGIVGASTPAYLYAYCARTGATSPVNISVDQAVREVLQSYLVGSILAPVAQGVSITSAAFAGLYEYRIDATTTARSALVLICLGAREGFAPRTAPGLYVLLLGSGIILPAIQGIGYFASLGTGPGAVDVASGTEGVQLYARGVIAYNNHAFCWGFDSADTSTGDGPNRVMFSNLGDPLTWGNDNVAAVGTDRAFTDSDAIVLGDAGDIIRAACVWNGRCFFGTNRGLHYIAGYGRDSFITNGATPVMNAYNVIGPHVLLEGPDRALYGVGDQGLWRFTGAGVPQPLFEKLRDSNGFSAGWWDLIWTDDTSPLGAYPGATNQDLVWLASDVESQQVLVGIPWCDAAAGSGPGEDTVVIKYHVRTGGFTRQVFSGVQYTAAGYYRREGGAPDTRFLATATSGETTLQRYGYKASATDAPVLPDPLPVAAFGPYSPFGPNGRGVVTRAYVVLSWDADALPLVATVAVTVDGVATDTFTVTVGGTAPGSPSAGAVWLDTSQSSTSIGNGTASGGILAAGGYLAKTYHGGAWVAIPGLGDVGQRVTLPLPLTRRMGTRWALTWTTTSAAGRWSLEGLGIDPGAGVASA